MKSYILLLTVLIFASCEDKEQGDKLTQNLTSLKGQVIITSRNGKPDNIKVLAESYSFKSTVYTDSLGQYKFSNLPFGTYKITFSKDSFTTWYLHSIKINGLDTLYNARNALMCKVLDSKIELSNISVQHTIIKGQNKRIVNLNINKTDRELLSFLFYFSNNKKLSKSDFQECWYSDYILPKKETYYVELPKKFLKIDTSKTIYFIGYLLNFNDYGYWDFDLNRKVYSTLSEINTGVLSVNYNEN